MTDSGTKLVLCRFVARRLVALHAVAGHRGKMPLLWPNWWRLPSTFRSGGPSWHFLCREGEVEVRTRRGLPQFGLAEGGISPSTAGLVLPRLAAPQEVPRERLVRPSAEQFTMTFDESIALKL